MLRSAIRWSSFAALLIAVAWAYSEPKWDSFLAVAASLAVFLGSFLMERSTATQSQNVEGGSTAVQAGRDASFNATSRKEER